jgi:hypothetical protein
MQIDGEHKLQPFSDLPRASLAFSISRLTPSLLFTSDSPVSSARGDRAHAARAWSMHIDETRGQYWGPATRSTFFRSDIGGETQGIQRFQLLEGVE